MVCWQPMNRISRSVGRDHRRGLVRESEGEDRSPRKRIVRPGPFSLRPPRRRGKQRPRLAGVGIDAQIPDRHQRLQRDPAGRQGLAASGKSVDHHDEPFHNEAELNGPIDGQER